jgi:hypothetical protein
MLLRNSIARVAIAIALIGAAEYPVEAQYRTPRTVLVGEDAADVLTRPALGAEVVEVVPPGTEMEVLQREVGWYWVMLEADIHGTRRAGWLHADDVDGSREATAMAVELKAHRARKKAEKKAEKNAVKAANRAERAAGKAAERAERAAQKADRATEKATAKAAEKVQKATEKAQKATEKAQRAAQEEPDTRSLERARRELEKARADYNQLTQPSSTPEKQ